jgi:hypothetical protein
VLKRTGVKDVRLDQNLPFLGALLKKEQDRSCASPSSISTSTS